MDCSHDFCFGIKPYSEQSKLTDTPNKIPITVSSCDDLGNPATTIRSRTFPAFITFSPGQLDSLGGRVIDQLIHFPYYSGKIAICFRACGVLNPYFTAVKVQTFSRLRRAKSKFPPLHSGKSPIFFAPAVGSIKAPPLYTAVKIKNPSISPLLQW